MTIVISFRTKPHLSVQYPMRLYLNGNDMDPTKLLNCGTTVTKLPKPGKASHSFAGFPQTIEIIIILI